MWILNLLPEFVLHILLLVGILGTVAGFLLGFIPFIGKYKFPIQVISIIILVFAVYLQGGIAERQIHEIEMAKLKAKLAEAEAKSAKVNTEIVTKILTKNKIVKEKGDTIVEYIDREVIKYDSTCKIPLSVISSHDAAAQNKTITELIDVLPIDEAAKPVLKLPKK